MYSDPSKGGKAEKEDYFELFTNQIDHLIIKESRNNAENGEIEPSRS